MRFAKFEGIWGFSVPSILLADLLGNTCLLARTQKVLVCDSWLLAFDPFCLFRVSRALLCDRPVSGNNRLVKFASQVFFFILVACKNKATSASFFRQKFRSPSRFTFAILGQSIESFSSDACKLGERVTFWFALTPPSLKWLTEQKNPKSLRSSQGAAWYNEFPCNIEGILKIAPFPWPPRV